MKMPLLATEIVSILRGTRRERERERASGEKEASEGNSFHRTREIEEDRGRIISLPCMREREKGERKEEIWNAHMLA